MAKKSKTQRAKASAARQQRKAARENTEIIEEQPKQEQEEEKPRKFSLKKTTEDKASDDSSKKITPKKDEKPKKKRFQFLRDVRGEMKRVTWPTRTDVMQWTGVVVVALIFFGVFVAVLDNVIITPLLILISGIGG